MRHTSTHRVYRRTAVAYCGAVCYALIDTEMAYHGTVCYALCGTEMAYDGTVRKEEAVGYAALLLHEEGFLVPYLPMRPLCDVRYWRPVCRSLPCDVRATRCPVLTYRMPHSPYALAMPCPVLTYCMVLFRYAPAMDVGTDVLHALHDAQYRPYVATLPAYALAISRAVLRSGMMLPG
eukprot:3175521-Rhodomonas_salina.1